MNQDYESNVHKNGLLKNQKELKKNTKKVANFFQHQSVIYASWFFRYFGAGVIYYMVQIKMYILLIFFYFDLIVNVDQFWIRYGGDWILIVKKLSKKKAFS